MALASCSGGSACQLGAAASSPPSARTRSSSSHVNANSVPAQWALSQVCSARQSEDGDARLPPGPACPDRTTCLARSACAVPGSTPRFSKQLWGTPCFSTSGGNSASGKCCLREGCKAGGARSELAGQYEESFADVEKRLLDFFTFKAIRVILKECKEPQQPQEQEGIEEEAGARTAPELQAQHHEEEKEEIEKLKEEERGRRRSQGDASAAVPASSLASPSGAGRGGGPGSADNDKEGDLCVDIEWLESFVVNNKVYDSKLFIRTLVQERQELAERVMVTRLHLFNTWAKKYNHAQMHAAIKDQNLELLRERLIQTVKFAPEDSSSNSSSSSPDEPR